MHAREEDAAGRPQCARARLRKGVGGVVHRMEDVGRRPARDYITSLLLFFLTSMRGNLVEPTAVPAFPLPLAGTSAPPAAHPPGIQAG